MRDDEHVRTLQWALPKLGYRWAGFRNVRRQVLRRVAARMRELDLPDATAYRARLEAHADEWRVLDSFCRISISRFYRDRGTFDLVCRELVPELARRAQAAGEAALSVWAAGCASGEEPYTLAIAWRLSIAPQFPALTLAITASDIDEHMLARAREGLYEPSSLRELPDAWREAAFEARGAQLRLRDELRSHVRWQRADLRTTAPEGPFHLVLCRNLAFTYFDERTQEALLARLGERMAPGSYLVLGAHERLPAGARGFIAKAHWPNVGVRIAGDGS
jgi:chemotaxis protein methyltransferase CheR